VSEPGEIVERGVIADGLRVATAMNDAPRALYARAPLIVLPGISFVWQDYRSLLTHYAVERRVFALDWPGFGGSAQPAVKDHRYTSDYLAQTLSTWINSLGLGRAVLLSTGISAIPAIRYAQAHPRRVLGLAFMSPIGFYHGSSRASVAGRLLRAPGLMRHLDGYITSLLIGPSTTEETRQVLERHQQLCRADTHRQAVQISASLWESMQSSRDELALLAKSLSAPAMVLHGALDPLVTQSDARQAASVLGERGTLTITLQESGHLPFLQQPAPFYRALSGLLETAEDAALASPQV
jgi:pimeloyl-ACP methyl ester carboxylesterase